MVILGLNLPSLICCNFILRSSESSFFGGCNSFWSAETSPGFSPVGVSEVFRIGLAMMWRGGGGGITPSGGVGIAPVGATSISFAPGAKEGAGVGMLGGGGGGGGGGGILEV